VTISVLEREQVGQLPWMASGRRLIPARRAGRHLISPCDAPLRLLFQSAAPVTASDYAFVLTISTSMLHPHVHLFAAASGQHCAGRHDPLRAWRFTSPTRRRADLSLTSLSGAPSIKVLRTSLDPFAPGWRRCAQRKRVAPVG